MSRLAFPSLAAIILAAIILAGCASLPPQTCSPGQEAMLTAELLFGRKIGDRLGVSEAAFRRFIDEEVTPRFPDGLTVLNASGQYRDADSRLIREPSKLLLIALKDEPEGRARLAAVAQAYKTRFHQQSVGTILRPACVSF